jgi:CTP:molybdopterin cytidylyltransferase MocA
MNEIAAILLAAGRSRRMGAFKPLLPFGNSTVIECCIDSLLTAGIESIVVVIGHRGEEILGLLRNRNLTFAVNPDPDSEMSSSIACGVELTSKDSKALLITPGDHPAVPPEVVTLLLKEWKNGARLVQPEHGGRGGHPVLVDLAYRAELLALDSNEGLRALFTSHREEVRRVPVNSPYVARDMDTWEDYRQLHEDVFGSAPPVS